MEQSQEKPQLNRVTSWDSTEQQGALWHFVWAGAAFVLYQLILGSVLSYARVVRNSAILPFEVFVFGSVATVLCLYSRIIRLQREVAEAGARSPRDDRRIHSAKLKALLTKRVAGLHQAIDQSLSAIMFFVRAQLGRAGTTQLQRDLREVMERIDQIKLLLLEMQHAVEDLDLLEAAPSSGTLPQPEASRENSVTPFRGTTSLNSLRKASRKAVVLPVTIRYFDRDTTLEFHTYTVNVCESGACILFASQDLENHSEVGVEMPQDFSSQARIRWIQPFRENSFRLAGIEFLSQRLAASSL